MNKQWLTLIGSFLMTLLIPCPAEESNIISETIREVTVNGFLDMREGLRLQDDKEQKEISIMEARLQLDADLQKEWCDFKYKADLFADTVIEETVYENREVWFFSRPFEYMDLKVGRQVLTWGTGEWVFLNDLFPKDWQSFFIGRDKEYLKAPSDALKLSLFSKYCNLDLIYTPRFDPDNYITGEYISGDQNDAESHTDQPDSWFSDGETAVRLHRLLGRCEIAFYGYQGFWKTPHEGNNTLTFSPLQVYGGSMRGTIYHGIANFEFAYYDSIKDRGGSDQLIPNSELRYLFGYTFDPNRDFNISVQYYINRMLQFSEYKDSLPDSSSSDRTRQLVTVTFTRLMMNQNIELLVPFIHSPDDGDTYIRLVISYKYTDNIIFEAGANIFTGYKHNAYFNNLSNNTSFYLAFKYFF